MRRAAPPRLHARRGLRRARAGARSHGLSGELLIRPASVADADAIGLVVVASWRAAYAGIVGPDFLDRLDPRERAAVWRPLMPDTTVLVAEYDGTVAGFTSLRVPAPDLEGEPATGEITTLYVDPERWRRGIGRALLDAAAAELRDAGCDQAVLWVFEANAAGRAFYEALGFAPDGARQPHGEAGPPEVRLRARLD